jgi:hypothetical protein
VTRTILNSNADSRLTGLERFLEFWLGPRRPEYGVPAESLAKIELPGSLRRFYAFAGRWPPASYPYCENRFHAQDRFLPLGPADWGSLHRSGPYLVFAIENQGVWEVATLPDSDDPRVWISENCSHRTPYPSWRELQNPLSHFLVTFVLQEAMMGANFGACHENVLDVLSEAGYDIERIWMDGEYAWEEVRHSYFLIDQRILLRRDTGDCALDDQWYGYNDPAGAEILKSVDVPTGVG